MGTVNFGRRRAVAESTQPARPLIARLIRNLAPLIILAWAAPILFLNLAIPSLEEVGRERNHRAGVVPGAAHALASSARSASRACSHAVSAWVSARLD